MASDVLHRSRSRNSLLLVRRNLAVVTPPTERTGRHQLGFRNLHRPRTDPVEHRTDGPGDRRAESVGESCDIAVQQLDPLRSGTNTGPEGPGPRTAPEPLRSAGPVRSAMVRVSSARCRGRHGARSMARTIRSSGMPCAQLLDLAGQAAETGGRGVGDHHDHVGFGDDVASEPVAVLDVERSRLGLPFEIVVDVGHDQARRSAKSIEPGAERH